MKNGSTFVFDVGLLLLIGKGGEVGPKPIYAFINIDATTMTTTIVMPL